MSTYSEIIKTRRSTRKFKNELLKPEQVEAILKAGLMAPSSKRTTPWEFVVVEDKNVLQELAVCKSHGGEFLSKAPLAIVILGDEQKTDVWIEDGSIAAIMMQLQIEELGLGSCWIQIRGRQDDEGQPAAQNVRDILDIPENYQPLCILAVGAKDEQKKPFDESHLKWEKIHIAKFRKTE